MNKPIITKECAAPLFESKFLGVYDLQYEEGKHYYNATRRGREDLVATKSALEYRTMLPDAVSCILVLLQEGEEPRLLLSREYRYPAGQFLLGVPAGLIDEKELPREEAVKRTAIREIREETGLVIAEHDRVEILSPFLFSSPGMTDESNAFVLVETSVQELSILSQDGAAGSERFDGFVLLTKAEAERILRQGCDDEGIFYPMATWMALIAFVLGIWENKETVGA